MTETATNSGSCRLWRLSGKVGEKVLSFPLAPGEYVLGSIAENDLVMSVQGVSRHHARLRVQEDSLQIEDLGSKNGTRINGRGGSSGHLSEGDRLQFGPVMMRVDRVSRSRAELALSWELESANSKVPILALEAPSDSAVVDEIAVLTEIWAKLEADEPLDAMLATARRGLQADGISLMLVSDEDGCTEARSLSSVGLDFAHLVDTHEVLRHSLAAQQPSESQQPSVARLVAPSGTLAVHRVACDSKDLWLLSMWWAQKPPSGSFCGLAGQWLAKRAVRGVEDQMAAGATKVCPRLELPGQWIAGNDPGLDRLYGQLPKALASRRPILITGESGVGKARLALTLHTASQEDPIMGDRVLHVMCSDHDFDSLAVALEDLDKCSSCVLEGVEDLDLAAQTLLVERWPADEVLMITTTGVELERRADEGTFLPDLFLACAGTVLHLPPLRHRRGHIPALVDGLVRRFDDTQAAGMTVDALSTLMRYRWPGNVSELRHELKTALQRCPNGHAIDTAMLSRHLRGDQEPGDAHDS